jgi:hypothetical protein
MASSGFFSLTTAIDFIMKCTQTAQKLRSSLRKIGRIELADDLGSWKRSKIINYYAQSVDFFEGRVDFFLACLELEDERINRDILETLFRGLIEIYCRILFLLNNDEDEKVKKIIWQELYLIGLSGIDAKQHESINSLISINYRILEDMNIEMPNVNAIKLYVQSKLEHRPKDRKIEKIEKAFKFPGVREVIWKYLDEGEEPAISKYLLYKRYADLSEQIHSNFLMEYVGSNPHSKYRILAFLMILYLKYLKAVGKITHSEAEIDALIIKRETFIPDYMRLWGFFKQY